MHIHFERKATQKSLSMTYPKSRKHNTGASNAHMFSYSNGISQRPPRIRRMSSATVQLLTMRCMNPNMRTRQLALMTTAKKSSVSLMEVTNFRELPMERQRQNEGVMSVSFPLKNVGPTFAVYSRTKPWCVHYSSADTARLLPFRGTASAPPQ